MHGTFYFVTQKRNVKTNIRLILLPLILCVLLVVLQNLIDSLLDTPDFKCGCACPNKRKKCNDSEKVCGVQYSDQNQILTCPVPHPPEWPPLLQLPPVLCKENASCRFNMLFTADNHSFAQSITCFFFFFFFLLLYFKFKLFCVFSFKLIFKILITI